MSGCWSHSAEHAGTALRPYLTQDMREWLVQRDGHELVSVLMLDFMQIFGLDAHEAGYVLGQWIKEQAR